MKHDLDKYTELLKQDALKQEEMMQQIIDARTKIPLGREQVSR